MVTTDQIESLGWKHKATARNGGSKVFAKGLFTLYSHADNFTYKGTEYAVGPYTSRSQDEITLSKISDGRAQELFVGRVETLDKLIEIIVKYQADVELCRDYKIGQVLNFTDKKE